MSDNPDENIWSVPYEELDENIVGLVKILNEFEGIYTVGSCGGHANNKHYQKPEGEWMVVFNVEFNGTEVSVEGWFGLEFLVWFCNNNLYRSGYQVNISPYSAPPYLNHPGNTISFTFEGKGVLPDFVVEELKKLKEECFISFENYQKELEYDEDDEFDDEE